jgi:hypothetical protein
MPVYKYKHSCGFEQSLFLKEDKETIVIPCFRCGNNATARQVRDKSLVVGEADGVTGILRRENQQPKSNRRR